MGLLSGLDVSFKSQSYSPYILNLNKTDKANMLHSHDFMFSTEVISHFIQEDIIYSKNINKCLNIT